MPTAQDLPGLLQKHFGFSSFRAGQERVIHAVLEGRDALLIMPTGGGKSLCFQLPAMILEGTTLVVSPLIALMKDQVDALRARGIPAAFINSSLSPAELTANLEQLQAGRFRMAYIAPERFRSPRFVRALSACRIARLAVDEAHCISQWGHDFRPDYLRLGEALESLGRPPVLALTATATPEVREDILHQLGLGPATGRPADVFVSGFARPNLTFAVSAVGGREDKMDRIRAVLQTHPTGIVYCATRKNVERVAAGLSQAGVSCVAYHAGMTEDARTRAQEKFMEGRCAVAAATNAFGMGIDRADLRFVIHHDLPGSVEACYQESGRAGRDGAPARCELLYNYADVRTQEFFIEGANPARAVIEAVHALLRRLCRKGPIEESADDLAERLPEAENPMAVGTALQVLEKAGFIGREYVPGSRAAMTDLIDPAPPLENLAGEFERLDAKRLRDTSKLRRMVAYATHRGCRHRFLLEYFGDPEATAPCPACDNCSERRAPRHVPTAAETEVILKALSMVARWDGRCGRTRLAQALAGSANKEVLQAGLDRVPTYGALRNLDVDCIRGVLDALTDAGCLEVRGGEYPLVFMTPLGREVVHGRQSVPVDLEKLGLNSERGQGGKSERAGRSRGTTPSESTGGPHDPAVFDALRQWRRRKAVELGNVPAFHIYADRTLRELASKLPRTESDLRGVHGIGPVKLKQFGRETLDVIRHSAPGGEQESQADA